VPHRTWFARVVTAVIKRLRPDGKTPRVR